MRRLSMYGRIFCRTAITSIGFVPVWEMVKKIILNNSKSCVSFIVFFLLTINVSCQTGVPRQRSNNGKEEKISFVSQKDTLVGYLSKPSFLPKYPLVIVLHSASSGNHDAPLYTHLEKTLNEIGVAVFSYDRRGYGQSQGNFTTASFADLANDALAAANLLRKRNDIIKNKVGLFGVSQGGWIAPLASQMDTSINFLLLVSSCGVTPARQMDYSAMTTLKMNGYNDSTIKECLHLRHIINEYYRDNTTLASAQKIVDQYKNEPWFGNSFLPVGQNGKLPTEVRKTKWWLEMDFRPETYFSTIKVPVALFYGSTDRWVPIEESITVWESALQKANNKNYEIFRIKNVGHLMIVNEDNNPKMEIFSDEYKQALQKFVRKVSSF